MALCPLEMYARRFVQGTAFDPHLADRAGRLEGFPATLVGYILHAGGPEELLKLASVLVIARWQKAFDEPVDGILYCAAAAVGFSCFEEFGYLMFGRLHASLFAIRATSTTPVHIMFASMTGFALGQGVGKGARGIPPTMAAYACAAIAHGLYDTLLSFPATAWLASIEQVLLLLVFTYVVRRALRGSKRFVAPQTNASIIRVGRWGPFIAHLVVLGAALSLLREISRRPLSTTGTVQFAVLIVAVSIATAVAALALVERIPLDVVIDEEGLTFSGVTHLWSKILSTRANSRLGWFGRRFSLSLEKPGGHIEIGPLSMTERDALEEEVARRRKRAQGPSKKKKVRELEGEHEDPLAS
jgi:PrsW family intramembrane metalloprotease